MNEDTVYLPLYHNDDLDEIIERLVEQLAPLGLEIVEVEPDPDDDLPSLYTLLEISKIDE